MAIAFTKINKDTNGNPRYVCHFLNFLTDKEKGYLNKENEYIEGNIPLQHRYVVAIKRAHKIGGKKYNNKKYGGGIVFQSHNIYFTTSIINSLMAEFE